MINYNWKEVVKLKGRIDPATITHAEKIVNLIERIEWNFNNIKYLPETSNTYKIGSNIIRKYAEEYKDLTGEYYKREWNETAHNKDNMQSRGETTHERR